MSQTQPTPHDNGARVGISAWFEGGYELDPLARQLDEIETFGVDTVEIPTFLIDLITRGRLIEDRVKALAAVVRDRPFATTVHGPIAINLMDDPFRLDLHLDVLKASIEVAARIGADHHVMHTGIVGDLQMPAIEDAFARQREYLTKAGDFAEEHGVILVVENVFTYQRTEYTALPARLGEEIKTVDHPNVWACFDFSHGYITSTLRGSDFMEEVAGLTPYSRHLHIHDSYGQPRDMKLFSRSEALAFGLGDLHLPLGLGDIPFDHIMDVATFPPGVTFNYELDRRYWSRAKEMVEQTRALANRARVRGVNA